jgi:hypothetical protein
MKKRGEAMTASIRIVALGTLVAIALALLSLTASPQAGASTRSINGIAKEKLLQPICTRANSREVFRVINPYYHRSKMKILAQGADRRFHMRQRSTRRIRVQMVIFSGPDPDAFLYINGHRVDADNVHKRRCR